MATGGDFVAFFRSLINQRPIPSPLEGIVVPGSWNPQKATVHILVGTTGALDPSEPDSQPIIHRDVPLLTNHIGDQGGPIGNERAILFPIEDQHTFVAMLFCDDQDSPQAAAGEKHLHLRAQDVQLALACFLKIQSDATRIGHQQKVTVLAPQVILGMDDASDDDALCRKKDVQKAVDDALQTAVQNAFNQFARTVQPGSGVAPPTVDRVSVDASTNAFAK